MLHLRSLTIIQMTNLHCSQSGAFIKADDQVTVQQAKSFNQIGEQPLKELKALD